VRACDTVPVTVPHSEKGKKRSASEAVSAFDSESPRQPAQSFPILVFWLEGLSRLNIVNVGKRGVQFALKFWKGFSSLYIVNRLKPPA
jgi:hypothetical protein